MLRIMDNRELAIEKICSLRNIHFYYIYKDDKSIPAVMVYYDKDKVINLCELDKHYEKLLQKIWEVYEIEKDKNYIIVDQLSKQILDNVLSTDIGVYNSVLSDCQKIEQPIYNHKGYMKEMIIPITKYVIEELYGLSEQDFLWNPISRDWFGVGEISATIGNDKCVFPYRISCMREGYYNVEVANVMKHGNKLEIGIVYKESGIEIAISGQIYKIEGTIKYIVDRELVCLADIKIDGKQVYTCHDRLLCENANPEKYILPGCAIDDSWKEYILPWGEVLLFSCKDLEQDEFILTDGMTAYVSNEDATEHQYIISYKNTVSKDKMSYTIYNYSLDIYKRGANEKQIHCCDLGFNSRGYYKTELLGSYYIDRR